jgi:hypothetical protein
VFMKTPCSCELLGLRFKPCLHDILAQVIWPWHWEEDGTGVRVAWTQCGDLSSR